MSDLLAKLKSFETQASTLLGIAEGAVVPPAKELARQVRELIADLEPATDDGDDA